MRDHKVFNSELGRIFVERQNREAGIDEIRKSIELGRGGKAIDKMLRGPINKNYDGMINGKMEKNIKPDPRYDFNVKRTCTNPKCGHKATFKPVTYSNGGKSGIYSSDIDFCPKCDKPWGDHLSNKKMEKSTEYPTEHAWLSSELPKVISSIGHPSKYADKEDFQEAAQIELEKRAKINFPKTHRSILSEQFPKIKSAIITHYKNSFKKESMPNPEENDNYEYGNNGEIQLKPENQIDAAEYQHGREGEERAYSKKNKIEDALKGEPTTLGGFYQNKEGHQMPKINKMAKSINRLIQKMQQMDPIND